MLIPKTFRLLGGLASTIVRFDDILLGSDSQNRPLTWEDSRSPLLWRKMYICSQVLLCVCVFLGLHVFPKFPPKMKACPPKKAPFHKEMKHLAFFSGETKLVGNISVN